MGLLQYQLAEATNLNDYFLSARLHETIRCIKMFDTHGYVLKVYTDNALFINNTIVFIWIWFIRINYEFLFKQF